MKCFYNLIYHMYLNESKKKLLWRGLVATCQIIIIIIIIVIITIIIYRYLTNFWLIYTLQILKRVTKVDGSCCISYNYSQNILRLICVLA